jgi:hypothetical protein
VAESCFEYNLESTEESVAQGNLGMAVNSIKYGVNAHLKVLTRVLEMRRFPAIFCTDNSLSTEATLGSLDKLMAESLVRHT